MYNLTDISTVKKILEKNDFRFSKNLGQNFIVNPTVCPRMVSESGIGPDSGVIEIGPGFGVLTCELAKAAKKVVSVELDSRLLPILADTLSDFDNVKIVNDDILKTDLEKLIAEEFEGMDVYICANLPYYITSPVIMALLQNKLPVKSITVMVQKEAAGRLCAEVGSRDSGAVTVAVNYYAEAEKLFDVSKGSFFPAPKVDSSVICLKLLDEPRVKINDENFFFDVVKAAFGQRRKTALNSLSSGLGMPKASIEEALSVCGFDPSIRAEVLDMNGFAALSDALLEMKNK